MSLNDTYFLIPAHLELFRARYFRKDQDGEPIETDIEEVFQREVQYIYQDDAAHAAEALDLRYKKQIIPAGRPLAQAGTQTKNLCNCFVLGFEADTKEAISDLKKTHMNIQAQGGGTGINFSTLRPRGSICKTNQSRSSGGVGFCTDLSYQSFNIQQGGNRSGANMGVLEDWHPDLYDFISHKSKHNWENIRSFATIQNEDTFSYFQWENPYQWQTFNVSVMLSDAFMDQVLSDTEEPWKLSWKGTEWLCWDFRNTVGPKTGSAYEKLITVTAPTEEMAHYKAASQIPFFNSQQLELVRGPYQLTAKEWFRSLAQNAWEDGCPGIIFSDLARRFHNGEYFNPLSATNPCVAEGTTVNTPDGPKFVEALASGYPVCTLLREEPIDTVEKRNNQPVYLVKFSDGATQRVTAGHIYHVSRKGNQSKKIERARLDTLVPGDKVQVSSCHFRDETYQRRHYLHGLETGILLGDGCYTNNRPDDCVKIASSQDDAEYNQAVKLLFGPSRFRTDDCDADSKSMSMVFRTDMLDIAYYDLTPQYSYEKTMPAVSNYSTALGILDGLLATDGDVNLKSNHPQVRWHTTSQQLALEIRNLLLYFGAHGFISASAHKGGCIDGREIQRKHPLYTVTISGESIRAYLQHERPNNIHPDKAARLRRARTDFRLSGNRWCAEIVDIQPDGITTVYDLFCKESDTWITSGYVQQGCAEQFLPDNSVCALASLCLPSFYRDGEFQFDEFKTAIHQAIRGLDNLTSLTKTGEPAIDANVLRERRIGLGTTGIGELLILEGLRYGSVDSRTYATHILEFLRNEAYRASINLAKERGSFPAFDYKAFSKSAFFKTLPRDIRAGIKEFGIRHVTLLTQAPVGTTGTAAGYSQGCEPYFMLSFKRNSRVGTFIDGSPAFRVWLEQNKIDYAEYDYSLAKLRETWDVPDYFVEAQEIHWRDHLKMQAVFAKHVDSSVSKTINLPNDATVDDVESAFLLAYKMGIKSTTIYRDGSKQQILEAIKVKKKENRPTTVIETTAPARPKRLPCDIHHTSVQGEKWTVLVGKLAKKPYEVFCAPQESFELSDKYKEGIIVRSASKKYDLDLGDFKLKNINRLIESDEHRVITRLLSMALRHGVPIGFMNDQLHKADGTVSDFSKAVLRILRKYQDVNGNGNGKMSCQTCGSKNIVIVSGCPQCLDCGWSKCE